jgi:modulator of FtsH protease
VILEGWSEFFVASAGASAALAGLIIVAMTVNVDLIIRIPGMASRAASAIAVLVLATVVALAGLIPGQSMVLFGAEVVALSAIALGITIDSTARVLRHRGGATVLQAVTKTTIGMVPPVAFAAGGILIAASAASGAGLLAVGTVTAILVSVVNAWVVLVEIKR